MATTTTILRPALATSKCVAPPKPGIHKAVPMDTYLMWDGASASRLGVLLDQSPMHLKQCMEKGDDDTAAKRRGTLLHSLMLEQSRFDEQYAIGPDVKLNIKAGKDEWAAFVKDNPSKHHIRGADGKAIKGMRASLWKHPLASYLLRCPGESELSITWVDAITGVVCKARVDRLVKTKTATRIVDLKTTNNTNPRVFSNRVYEYGYHLQGATNMTGMAVLREPVDSFDIIAVESEPPYAACVHRLGDDVLEAGDSEMRSALSVYATCCNARQWPGYGWNWKHHRYEPVAVGEPPAWWRRRVAASGGAI